MNDLCPACERARMSLFRKVRASVGPVRCRHCGTALILRERRWLAPLLWLVYPLAVPVFLFFALPKTEPALLSGLALFVLGYPAILLLDAACSQLDVVQARGVKARARGKRVGPLVRRFMKRT